MSQCFCENQPSPGARRIQPMQPRPRDHSNVVKEARARGCSGAAESCSSPGRCACYLRARKRSAVVQVCGYSVSIIVPDLLPAGVPMRPGQHGNPKDVRHLFFAVLAFTRVVFLLPDPKVGGISICNNTSSIQVQYKHRKEDKRMVAGTESTSTAASHVRNAQIRADWVSQVKAASSLRWRKGIR